MTIDVSVYIKELLFGHDCVIIPGFGAFIGNYSAARIDREAGLFYPPSKKVTFNRHLINNDGLLIGHLSSRTGIGYGEARDIVSAFAGDLRNRITPGNRVSLPQIGTFSLNREDTLIFEPDSEANYLLTSYGLDTFHRQPVKDYDVRKRVLEQHHKPTVPHSSVKRMLTRAAVIIPLLVAMALVPFHKEIFKGKVEESSLNPLARAELEYNRSQITNITPAVTVDSSALSAPVTPAVIVQEERFMIVTGSFQSEANALTMVESLRNRGYDPVVSSGPNGFLRVSAKTYDTMTEAEAALKSLNRLYSGSWICKTR